MGGWGRAVQTVLSKDQGDESPSHKEIPATFFMPKYQQKVKDKVEIGPLQENTG